MLNTRARVSPCRALASRESSTRFTVTVPSVRSMDTRSIRERDNSTLLPLTLIVAPSKVTSTPLGTAMGIFPIRLISPNLTHDLATETTATRLTVRHQTLARGDHGH